MGNGERFAHVLLFQCPKCSGPLAISNATANKNLEDIDASSFETWCVCGWFGKFLGLKARRHWVEPWSA